MRDIAKIIEDYNQLVLDIDAVGEVVVTFWHNMKPPGQLYFDWVWDELAPSRLYRGTFTDGRECRDFDQDFIITPDYIGLTAFQLQEKLVKEFMPIAQSVIDEAKVFRGGEAIKSLEAQKKRIEQQLEQLYAERAQHGQS